MAGFELGYILNQATQLLGLNTQLGNKQVQELNEVQGGYDEMAAGQEESGLLGSQIKRAELMGQFETEQARLQAAVAAGTSVGAQSDILTPMLASLREQAGAFTTAQAKVSEIEANSDIINNPLGWLRDLVQGDQARAQRDAVASKFDATTKQVAALNAATQQTAATQNAIQTTLTAASIDQMAEQQVIDAQIKATETRMQGKLYGIEGIKAAREMGSENFRTLVSAYSLQTDETRYQEGKEFREEQAAAMKAARKDREKDEDYYSKQAEHVNRYLRQIGKPEMPVHWVKSRLTGGGEMSAQAMDWIEKGARLEQTGGLIRVYGNDVVDSYKAIVRDRITLPESYKGGVEALMGEATKRATETLNAVGATAYAKDPKSFEIEFEKAVTSLATQYTSDIQPGTKNPYQAPAISTVLSERPEIAASNFGKLILSGLSATGKDETDPALILAMTAKAVKNKTIDLNEAVMSMEYYFKEAVNLREATRGFMQTGAPTSPGYKSRVEAFAPSFGQSFGVPLGLGGAVVGSPIAAIQVGAAKIKGDPMGSALTTGQYHRPLEFTDPKDIMLGLNVMMAKDLADEILSAKPQ